MGINKAEHQAKKNQIASNAMKELAKRIVAGGLEVEFTELRQGLEKGVWVFRCKMIETENYKETKQLSEV